MNLKFQSWGLKTKLIALCALLSGVSVVVGTVGYFSLKNVNSEYAIITSRVMVNMEAVDGLEVEFWRVRAAIRTYGFSDLSPADIQKAIEATNTAIKNYEKGVEAYVALGFIPGQKEKFENLNGAWQSYLDVAKKAEVLVQSDKPSDRQDLMKLFAKDFPAISVKYTAASTALSDFHRGVSKAQVEKAEAVSSHANQVSFWVIICGLISGMFLGFLISGRIAKELRHVSDTLTRGSTEVASAVTQLSAASDELSASASEQAASIQETAASVEEINAMVKKNTDSAVDSARVSDESRAHAERGKIAVEAMLTSMDEIQRSNATIQSEIQKDNEKIGEIIHVIQEIGSKTKVINDIVFQTKLLSFNASVEAARAGEHGKGFAVVAEEVGNLAQMSGNAAKEISTLLDESVAKVETIVKGTKEKVENLMKQARTTVDRGGQTAKDCDVILQKILENATHLSEMVTSISTASQEQSHGVGEISKAIQELDQATQINATATQQTSASAASLSSQIQSLKEAADQLDGVIEGGGAARSVVAKSPPKTEGNSHPRKSKSETDLKNVVNLRPKAPQPTHRASTAQKKVVGGETFPSENDPRFEDV